MGSKLPAPLPILAAAGGAAGFAAARFLGIGQGGGAAPAPGGAPVEDTGLAGSTSDLWSQFGGGTQDFGDGGTGPGALPGPYDPGGIGFVPPPAQPPLPTDDGSPFPPANPPTGTGTGGTSGPPGAIGRKPAGAVGYISVKGLRHLYTVSGGTATEHDYTGLQFSAWVGPAAHFKPNATLHKILTGSHSGAYVAAGQVTVH